MCVKEREVCVKCPHDTGICEFEFGGISCSEESNGLLFVPPFDTFWLCKDCADFIVRKLTD